MLSLVVPIFNEENLIDELLKRTVSAVESFSPDYEIIFVDDGSKDNSLNSLLSWQQGNNKLKILALSRTLAIRLHILPDLNFQKQLCRNDGWRSSGSS